MNRGSTIKKVARRKPQQGMVLLLCMIFLTAMMLLGLSASADTILQNQLVSNLQISERVKQAAQATLINAEQWLLDQGGPEPESCMSACTSPAIYSLNHLPSQPEQRSYEWWLENGHRPNSETSGTSSGSLNINNTLNAQVWLVETVFSIDAPQDNPTIKRVWYRILARAGNRSGTVVSVVESLFVHSWPLIDSSDEENEEDALDCPVLANCGRVAWRRLR